MSWKNWSSWLKGGLIGGIIGFLMTFLGNILLLIFGEFLTSPLTGYLFIMLKELFFKIAFFPSLPWIFLIPDELAHALMFYRLQLIFIIILSTINGFIIGSMIGFFIGKIKFRSKKQQLLKNN